MPHGYSGATKIWKITGDVSYVIWGTFGGFQWVQDEELDFDSADHFDLFLSFKRGNNGFAIGSFDTLKEAEAHAMIYWRKYIGEEN